MNLPAPRYPVPSGRPVAYEPQVNEADPGVSQFMAMLKRRKWLILVCAAVAYGAATIYGLKAERVYQASVSLQIEESQPNIPDMLRAFYQTSDITTDIEVLGSRTLVEGAARMLSLQIRLTSPRDLSRDRVLGDIHVEPQAKHMEYTLERQRNGSFDVRNGNGVRVSLTRPGERLSLEGVTLRLTSEAAKYPELRIEVRSFSEAVARTNVKVERAEKDAEIIKVRYEDTDRDLVWKVPNAIAERFIEGRQEAQKVQTRSQAKFLREQIDTIGVQLAAAESDLKTFRERARVVNPSIESSSQINRLVNLEAERSSLEAERSALAGLLQNVEERHKQQAQGWRRRPERYRSPAFARATFRERLRQALRVEVRERQPRRTAGVPRGQERKPVAEATSAQPLALGVATSSTTSWISSAERGPIRPR